MNTNTVPCLQPDTISRLTDEQIISWYSKHPNPTVRALVERIAYNKDKHAGELVNSYQEGYQAANAHGLTPEELRLGAAYVESYIDFN